MEKVNCHNLRILKRFFEPVLAGTKKFEIRFDDRGYKKGDFIVMHEYSDEAPHYSGRTITKRIGFITNYEQKEGFVVFSLLDLV